MLYGLPVSNVSRPAFRVRGTRLLIERMTLYQDLSIQAAVALHRCDEADPAVPMLGVVPAQEFPDPGTGVVQAGKAALRPLRAVFQGAEQRLGEGIVIAHPGPAARGPDAQVVHLGQQVADFIDTPLSECVPYAGLRFVLARNTCINGEAPLDLITVLPPQK